MNMSLEPKAPIVPPKMGDQVLGPASTPYEKAVEERTRLIETRQAEFDAATRELAEVEAEIAQLDADEATLLEIEELTRQYDAKNAEIRSVSSWNIAKKKRLIKDRAEIVKQIISKEKEQDEKDNPFKYFLISKMDYRVPQIMFGRAIENVEVKDIDETMGETAEDVKFWDIEGRAENAYTINISSNGFLLQLENKKAVTTNEGVLLESPEARYRVLSPDWSFADDETGLSYEEGMALLRKKAEDYQDTMIEEFNRRNGK
jgi:hypothetical protein